MKTELGKQRRPYRIREWLDAHDIEVNALARELGVHHSLVSATIHGRRNNRRVLHLLVERGCPVRYLALPADMREAA